MRTQLEETLQQLHQQLGEIDSLQPEEKVRLQTAVDEIQESLDREEVSSHSLAERLSEATAQFNEAHPSLANSVGRIADMLSQMGI